MNWKFIQLERYCITKMFSIENWLKPTIVVDRIMGIAHYCTYNDWNTNKKILWKIKIISNEIYGWVLWSIFSFNDLQWKLMLLFVDIFNLKNEVYAIERTWHILCQEKQKPIQKTSF